MDQLRNAFRLSRTQLISLDLRNREALQGDPFAQELLDLWDAREMRGFCYTVHLYTMPVGFLLLEIAEKATIRGIWVNSMFRKYGIGTTLVKAVQFDIQRPVLHVNANETAVGFWEKLGFVKGERREDFPDQIRMTYERVL